MKHFLAIIFVATFFISCTKKNSGSATPSSSGRNPDEVAIQKDQGINVGETNAIWAVGMKQVDSTLKKQVLKIHRVTLDPMKNYPVKTWSHTITGDIVSGTGSRTFVSEWGILIGRAGNGYVKLILVDENSGPTEIWSGQGLRPPSRATAFSYMVKVGGTEYKFAAIAYLKNSPTGRVRVERFLKTPTGFQRVRPYEQSTSITNDGGIYTGFLDPCSTLKNGECAPKFYGGIQNERFGVDLTFNVPASNFVDENTTLTAPAVEPPNAAFVSTSHPNNGAQWGGINKGTYSWAGDPETGELYTSGDPTDWNNFMSYDRVNEIVFRVTRESKILQDGTQGTNAHSVVAAFKKECFINQADCSPTTTNRSRFFLDVGETLGPTSDLGNGCVAILGLRRPGEPGGADFISGVYKVCPRDNLDLDKGLSVLRIGSVEGATYMYNDFTAATLYERPVFLLFDFETKGLQSIKSANYLWTPKPGFSTTPTGLNVAVRCFKKGQTPPAFTSITLGKGVVPNDIASCSGSVNQVEFKLERVPKTRFTRFQSFKVSVQP